MPFGSVVAKDDPRIAILSRWIVEARGAGEQPPATVNLCHYFAVRALADDAGRDEARAADLETLGGELAGLVELLGRTLREEGAPGLVIDQFGGTFEQAGGSARICAALAQGEYAVATVAAVEAGDLEPWPDAQDPEEQDGNGLGALVAALAQGSGKGAAGLLLDRLASWLREDRLGAAAGSWELVLLRHLGPQLRPQLDRQIGEVAASRRQLPGGAPVYDGSDVLVGAVDYGCDFVHPNFRMPAGGTRIVRLWDQNGPPAPGATWPGSAVPLPGGRVFDRARIDRALSATGGSAYIDPEDLPYHELQYHPHDNYYAEHVATGAHGTHVLDIACGNGRATSGERPQGPGVAPEADIVFVQAAAPAVIQGWRRFDPWSVVFGAAYVFALAAQLDRPAVVNVSLNGTEGPHDGDTPWDRMLDWICQGPGRAIVVGAGNFCEDRLHARGEVVAHGRTPLVWRFGAADRSLNQMEIWYRRRGAPGLFLTVTLVTPWGEHLRVPPRTSREIKRGGRLIGVVSNGGDDPFPVNAGASLRSAIYVSVMPHADEAAADGSADWRLVLEMTHEDGSPPGSAGGADLPFNAWISRDDAGQSCFAEGGSDPELTLGTVASFRNAIVVGAYGKAAEQRSAASFSSCGPTCDDRAAVPGAVRAPQVSAPGLHVMAARSLGFRVRYPDGDRRWRTAATMAMSGTSVAAPFVTGAVALMLQKNRNRTADEIRRLLVETARPFGAGGVADPVRPWDMQLGYGLLSVAAAVAADGPAP